MTQREQPVIRICIAPVLKSTNGDRDAPPLVTGLCHDHMLLCDDHVAASAVAILSLIEGKFISSVRRKVSNF
jgi:hypothetical protein